MSAVLLMMPIYVFAQTEAEVETDTTGGRIDQPTIVLNGEQKTFEDPVIFVSDRIMVPIRELTEALNGIIVWNQEDNEVLSFSVWGDEITYQPDHPILQLNGVEYRMDSTPINVDGRIYVPLRHAAEFLHATVEWDSETATATVTAQDPYIIQEGDTLDDISEYLGIEAELLSERNQLEDGKVEAGHLLKTVIPDIMVNIVEEPVETLEAADDTETETYPYTEEEMELLAKIVMVEAGYEPYDGQLAVANVVLNRVNHQNFPDSIRDVIYAPGQFPPAHNGKLDRAEPNDSVWKAVRAAASGENIVEGALYFHNPKVSSGGYWSRLTEVARIGNHRFVK